MLMEKGRDIVFKGLQGKITDVKEGNYYITTEDNVNHVVTFAELMNIVFKVYDYKGYNYQGDVNGKVIVFDEDMNNLTIRNTVKGAKNLIDSLVKANKEI